MATDTIEKEWVRFRATVIPKDASAVQLKESKLCFFAGAQTMLALVSNMGGDCVSEDAGVEFLESLHQEMRKFTREATKPYRPKGH